jgi:uncharacterized protein (TIGR03000 family)
MPQAGEGDKTEDGATQIQKPAMVVVKAAADVKITVNGHVTARRATEESFLTPKLPAGRPFAYVFQAEAMRDGKKVTRTERITVRAGQKTAVDFSDLDRVAVSAEPAQVTVVLPRGAQLYVNGVAMAADGKQTFLTPKLDRGKKFFYTVKAELLRDGRKVTESQRVSVQAGSSVTVDFTAATSTLTASR